MWWGPFKRKQERKMLTANDKAYIRDRVARGQRRDTLAPLYSGYADFDEYLTLVFADTFAPRHHSAYTQGSEESLYSAPHNAIEHKHTHANYDHSPSTYAHPSPTPDYSSSYGGGNDVSGVSSDSGSNSSSSSDSGYAGGGSDY